MRLPPGLLDLDAKSRYNITEAYQSYTLALKAGFTMLETRPDSRKESQRKLNMFIAAFPVVTQCGSCRASSST